MAILKKFTDKNFIFPLFFLCLMVLIHIPNLANAYSRELDEKTCGFWAFWLFLILGILLILMNEFLQISFENKAFITVFILGCSLALLSPVANGWDEDSHFFKVVATLDGKGLDADDYSYRISESYFTLTDDRLDYLSVFDDAFKEQWSEDTALCDRVDEGYAQVTYPAWGYVFCLIGVWLAKALSFSTGMIFLTGRIFNLLGFCLIGRYAIKTTPKYKNIFALFMMIPQTLIVSSSYSCDSVVYGLIMVLVAFFIKWKADDLVPLKEYVVWAVLLVLLGPLKYPYLALLGLLFLLPAHSFTAKRANLIKAATILCAVLVSVLWLVFESSQYTEIRVDNFDMALQLDGVIHHPLRTLWIFISSINTLFPNYVSGNFYISCEGAQVPGIAGVLFLIFTLYCLSANTRQLRLRNTEKLWLSIVILGVWLVTMLAVYLSYSSVGALTPEGTQGRYLTPTIVLLALLMSGKLRPRRRLSDERVLSYATTFLVLLATTMSYYFYFA